MIIDSKLKYLAPESMEDFMTLWTKNDKCKIFGGGTDLIPLMKYGVKDPNCFLSLSRLDETRGIVEDDENLSIGASTTLDDISRDPMIIDLFPSLAYSARCVASPQIRNTATIGGNIIQDRRCIYYNQTESWRSSIEPCFKTGGDVCHQAPRSPICKSLYYSDLAPVLIALGAEARVLENGSRNRVRVKDLVAAHVSVNGTAEDTGLLVLGFIIPKPAVTVNVFHKYSVRQSIDFPVLNMALNYTRPSEESSEGKASIVIGAAGPEPFSLHETEKNLVDYLENGTRPLDQICQEALREITEKSSLVRETGLTLAAKRKYFKNIIPAVREFIEQIKDCCTE